MSLAEKENKKTEKHEAFDEQNTRPFDLVFPDFSRKSMVAWMFIAKYRDILGISAGPLNADFVLA